MTLLGFCRAPRNDIAINKMINPESYFIYAIAHPPLTSYLSHIFFLNFSTILIKVYLLVNVVKNLENYSE